jgi:hypothetical protein
MLHALLPLHRMVLVETLLLVRKLTIQQEQGKMQVAGNPKKTTKFKKKNMGKVNIPCFVYGKGHLAVGKKTYYTTRTREDASRW